MSIKTEIAEMMENEGQVYSLAEKIVYNERYNLQTSLTNEEKEISSIVDAWAKDIGTKGSDSNNELSSFIVKTITDPVYQTPNSLIETMFETDAIGEFDDYIIDKTAKNTLVAYDAAKGGNVDKSYMDGESMTPTWKHSQIETEVSFAKLRRNGFDEVSKLIVYIKEAFENKKITDVFKILDNAIVGGDQVINAVNANPTVSAMDDLALYVIDHVDDNDIPFAFALNKYAQQIARMSGHNTFMSENMKNSFNRFGLVKEYAGMLIGGVSGAKKNANGALLIPDKRIFGVAGKIGVICDRGDLRVYETPDVNKEKFNIKATGYEYGIKVTNPEKVAKIVLT